MCMKRWQTSKRCNSVVSLVGTVAKLLVLWESISLHWDISLLDVYIHCTMVVVEGE